MPPMNTSPDQLIQHQPKLQPLSEALTAVYKEIESKDTQRETPTTFFDKGRERVVTSDIERAVADMQASVAIAKQVLDSAVESGDYRQEQVAAKAFAAIGKGVDFATFYAELFSQSPSSAETLKKMMLRFFDTVKADEKYLVQPA
jgi:uncharacterized NAD-dependent epimerase/dehydratase family protein